MIKIKIKIFAFILMIILIGAVSLNTYVIDRKISGLHDKLELVSITDSNTEQVRQKVEEIFEEYKSCETYVSLTVNHDDLTNIEDNFAELIGNLSVGDADSAKVTKNRLLYSLEHLRRLSGINVDSVI